MNATHQGIITLLKSAITGQSYALPQDFDLARASAMVRAHHMSTLIYAGALNCGISAEHAEMKKLFQYYCQAQLISERQMRELDRLYDAFEKNGLDYMPMKGSILKALYPRPEMRLMGDADILIRQEQYDRIVPIVEQLGFKGGDACGHHYVWEKKTLSLELHHMMVPVEYRIMHAYYGTGWKDAHPAGGRRYAMSAEDTFIFLLSHFAKHFRGGGIGCRHVVDLWVYLRANPSLDEKRLLKRLDELHLQRFYHNIRKLIQVWFEDAAPDETTECLTEYIMRNGSWGNATGILLSAVVREQQNPRSSMLGARLSLASKWIYPGAHTMRLEYPILKTRPALLPLYACMRFFKKITSLKVLKRKTAGFLLLNKQNIDQHQQMLDYFGLEEEN